MKRILWVVALIGLTVLALDLPTEAARGGGSGGGGGGTWINASLVFDCASRICAEWYSPGDVHNGTYCCIDSQKMGTTNFGDCVMVVGKRPGGSMF